eukprot:CAMPEP_0172643028 /NCGR_PEP_ID=MMETSP1068-20121228/234891_1 /TAXON_ID=35684 /ORGANISM="Pseudopedinella elastica, Strain CCMP716" /LENGTH=48 /DNA_ID= /DNA_START= /DNA_END= /DNA_ORIENTATION=
MPSRHFLAPSSKSVTAIPSGARALVDLMPSSFRRVSSLRTNEFMSAPL